MVAESELELRTLFARWLRRRREALDLSPEALSEQLGPNSSPDAVLAWEMGSVRPSRRLAERLAKFFDISHNEHAAFVLFAISDLDSPDEHVPADIGAGLAFDPDAPWRVQPQSPSNLPKPLTTFVGREADVEQVAAYLSKPAIRLLTLLGPPGIGKTRLSIEAARRLMSSSNYEDGVFFVPLAALTDGSGLAQTLASTLGVKEATGRPAAEVLADYLRDKRLLLVLDNLEQINDVGPPLADLLTAAPQVQVIGTSRTALHVYGEQVWRVPALPVPPISAPTTADTLSQSEAADLFVQRARSVYPEFIVDDVTAPVIAEICRKLDGLPLAIELAAARVNVLKPQALLARLDSRLGVLTGGSQNLPPRQRTLRGAIDWSYNLLDAAEKLAYRRLSVFVGGSTLEAAEQAMNIDQPHQSPGLDTLDLIASLLDKSLLRQDDGPDGVARYAMLETIREYGLERLQESGEENEVRRAHAQAMLSLAEEAEPHMTTGGRDSWLRKLDADLDNIRAALSWSLGDSGATDVGLRLAGGLGWYWYFRGHFTEGRKWLDKGREVDLLAFPPVIIAKLLQFAGWLANQQADFKVARSRGEESIPFWRQADRMIESAVASSMLGISLVAQGEIDAGCKIIDESLAIVRQLNSSWYCAFVLNLLAQAVTWRADFAQAEACWQESHAIYERAGDLLGVAETLSALADLQLVGNNLSEATRDFERALRIQLSLGNKQETAFLFYKLADAAFLAHDNQRAYRYLENALSLYRELGVKRGINGSLRHLGYLALADRDYSRAVALYRDYWDTVKDLATPIYKTLFIAGMAGLSSSLGNAHMAVELSSFVDGQSVELYLTDRIPFDKQLSETRKTLSQEQWNAAWKHGRQMTLNEAVALALEVFMLPLPSVDPNASSASKSLATTPSLSKRELELLRLVASGLTNQEVASRLFLSSNTVRAHLYTIYSKIDVTSRTAAARFATDHGLL